MAGDLDASNYTEVIKKAQEQYDAGARDLLIDLEKVPYMSSAGLMALHTVSLIFAGQGIQPADSGRPKFRALDLTKDQAAREHVKLLSLMRVIAFYLFYFHIGAITLYRTYIFYAHLRKRDLVREVLMHTVWKRKLEAQPNIVLEITHAYVTGLLTHLILIAPWFLVISHFKFSLLFLPVVCAINLFTQARYLKVLNAWYYRIIG